jgi:PST family polysaccharide transporter
VSRSTDPRPDLPANLAWTVGTVLGTRLITLAGLAVLARLLAPAEFGLMAFALVYITYVTAVGDLGTGTALVYWPARRDEAAQVTFVASVAMGVCWLVVTLVMAPAVAAFFQNPAGAPLLRALAWTFPIQALGATHEALCRKSLRFKAWLWPEMALAGGKAVVSVVLAAWGWGAWSLVWGQLAGQLLRTVLLWRVVDWRPTRGISRDLVGPMFTYGRSIVGVNALSAIVHHADVLIVARALGATALGFYQLATKIPEVTVTLLVRGVSYVIFPALSQVHAERRDLSTTFLPTLRGVGLATVPVVAAVVVLAEPLVVCLFGARWTPSVPIVQALTIAACLRALGTHAGDLMKAVGRPHVLVVLASIKAAVLIPSLLFAAGRGMVAVAAASAVASGLSMVLNLSLACRHARIPRRAIIDALCPGLAAAGAVTIALTTWRATLGPASVVITLSTSLPLALSAYLAALRWTEPALFVLLGAAGRRAIGRLRAAPARLAGANTP